VLIVSNKHNNIRQLRKIFFGIIPIVGFLIGGNISLIGQCPSPDVAPYVCGPAAHCDCATWPKNGIIIENSPNVDFEFDKISQYLGGISFSGSTIIHIKMDSTNSTCSDGSPCKWKLVMFIDNFGVGGNQWDKTATYGTGVGTKPTLDLIQLRVYNGCNTPICESFQSFNPIDDASIDIVNSAVLIPAGACTTNVNGVGSYLNHYNEYTYTVDYRIIPGFDMAPGMYQLSLNFCLVED
jgi:hypothetical protein